MPADPLASMQCWAIGVTLGGREYEIPALPAMAWWPVLMGDVDVQDLLPVDAIELDDQLLDGVISAKEVSDALTEVIEEAAGRPLHSALVLASLASAQWEIVSGRLALAGFRWDVMPLGAALDAIYAMRMESLDDDGRKEFLKIYDPEAAKKAERAAARAAFTEMVGAPPSAKSSGVRSEDTPPRSQPRHPSRPRRARSAVPIERP